jgi:hypothetical protein
MADLNIDLNQTLVSTVNSTSVALNAGATFTGTSEDISIYSNVVISVFTDQNGTYTIQFSNDGTNWDSVLTRYYRTNQINVPHRFARTRRYVRVTFTNTSAVNQTYLRLQTILGDVGDLNIPIDANMSQDYDSVSVRPTDYRYEVALGRRQGAETWNKFGYNSDADTGTEIIGAFGGTFTPLTTASTLTIVSSSTDDDGSPSGTGANTVTIIGIDANHEAQTEVLTMNGTSNVVTATTWLGINRAFVSLAGNNKSNVGLITITATTGGSTQATIPIGEGTTQQAIFFTYAKHKGLADTLVLNAEKLAGGATPKVTFKGWLYNYVTNTNTLIFNQLMDTMADNNFVLLPSQPFLLPEKSCLYFTATTDTNDSYVACRFSLIQYRDVDA